MKPTIAFVLLCVSVLIGCKKSDPVGPDSSPALPGTVSTVIGAAGGSLTTTGFTLTIPPGAFSASETLKVGGETYDNAFGTQILTGVFKLEGLPATFSRPLEVKLKCDRAASDGRYVAVGRQMTSSTSGKSAIFYSPITSTLDSAFLKATLLPDSMGGFSASARKTPGTLDLPVKELWFLGVDEFAIMMSPIGHFKLFFPRALQTGVLSLVTALEAAYQIFFYMDFDRTAYDRIFQPINVVVRNGLNTLPLPPGDLYSRQLPGVDEFLIGLGFDEGTVSAGDLPTIQRAAGQVLCNLFCAVNDPLYSETPDALTLAFERNRIWPYYAIGAWAGEVLPPPGTGGGAPLHFRMQQMCPFEGLTASSGETPAAHGLGLSPLIQYIAKTYTPDLVFQLYYTIPQVDYAIDALQAILPVPEKEWWPEFLKSYIAGDIYNVTSDDLLSDLSSPTSPRLFIVQGAGDTLKKFSDTFADLSAKLYRVNLRYAGLDTSALLRFSTGPASLGTQYVGVMLFGLKGKTLTYWQYANTVTVKQAKDLTASGYDIVAAVVNCLNESPYSGTRTIDLTVTVESGAGKPMSASFRSILKGTQTYSGFTEGQTITSPGTMYYSSGLRKGTMTAGAFTANWSETSPDFPSGTITVTGDLVIHLNGTAPPAHVTRFSVKETILHSAYNNEVWEVTSSGSCDIPAYWENNKYVHRISGALVRSHVATTVNRYDSFGDKYWRLFSNPSGDGQDLIEIIIQ